MMHYHAIDVTTDDGHAMGWEGEEEFKEWARLCKRNRVEHHLIIGKRHTFVVFAWCGLEGDLTRELALSVATNYAQQFDNGTLTHIDLRR